MSYDIHKLQYPICRLCLYDVHLSIPPKLKGVIFIAKYFNIPYDFLIKNDHNSDIKIRVFLFSYIQYNLTGASEVNTSLEHIMYHAGLSSVRSAKKSPKRKQILDTLYELEDEGYISLPDKQLDEIGFSDLFIIEVLYGGIPIDGYKADGTYKLEGQFVKIEFEQYKRIILENHSRTNITDFYIFTYIKAHIFNRGKSQTIEERAESWGISYNDMSIAAEIDPTTVKNTVERLDNDMHLIKYSHPKNIRRGYKEGKVRVLKENCFNLKTVYVLNKDGWEDELVWGMKKYRNDSYNKFGEIKQ